MPMSPDRIEKTLVLRASRSQVWQALANAGHFGEWFGCTIDGAFTPGTRVTGRITTPGYDHLTMDLFIEQMVPDQLFSYRWHPYAIDPKTDYSKEPTTLVEFRLEEVPEGTRLTVVESGFDHLPAERRDLALRMNDGGWTQQVLNIEKHVIARAGAGR
ncbi:MAG: SRPBCC family protein [Vicinamibacterales bacterium]